jgi:transglutaminase-like putative cysteine protease
LGVVHPGKQKERRGGDSGWQTVLWLTLLVLAGAVQGWSAETGSGSARASEGAIWRRPAFSLKPSELLRAAARVAPTPGEPVDILHDESRIQITHRSRYTQQFRIVYRVNDARGARTWNAVQAPWAGWVQKRPRIRARVITPEGAELWVKESATQDLPSRGLAPGSLTDGRLLRVPLPGVKPGSVVEAEVTERQHTMLPGGGVTPMYSPGKPAPVHHFLCRLEVSPGIPLRYTWRSFPGEMTSRDRSTGKSIRVEWEGGPVARANPGSQGTHRAAERNREDGVSGMPLPVVLVSTERSWADVSARYAAYIEPRLRGKVPQDLMAGIPASGISVAELAARLTQRMHERVRYTAVHTGRGAIVPKPPAETLRLGAGDCKDKAVLLIAMLRHFGVEAQLALLTPRPAREPHRGLPSLSLFGHAVVYVPGADLWIDASSDGFPAGILPGEQQGRLALLIGGGEWSTHGSELRRTPSTAFPLSRNRPESVGGGSD